VNERDGFLKLLTENEDDTTTRLVYADWLDDRGEHEEADRQRKWPAAKEWLVRFCEANNHSPDEPDPYEWVITYETLLELGQEGVGREDEWYGFSCGNNMTMCDALRENPGEFWKNWSIVTGVPLPQDIEMKSGFSCGC
jgi:uncharacterized protein (TIGR02996 family)